MKKNKGKEKLKNGINNKVDIFNEKKLNRRIILFFIFACFFLYGKGIKNNYAMDDEFVVKNNAMVQKGIKAIPEIFRTTYVIDNQKSSYEYRPLVKVSYAIECQFFGPNPHVSHFFNILLYAISLVLLYYLLLQLLPEYNHILAFLITLIFMVHPLHSEVVLSIKNRDVILSFLGCLLSLWFYMKYAQYEKYYYLFFGAFFMLFAVMSKKDSMTYFAVIPFTLWFFKNTSFKKIGMIFLSYLITLISFHYSAKNVARSASRGLLEWENPLYIKSTLIDRIPTGLYSIYFYLKMYIIPYPLLSYYGYNQVPIAKWSDPIVWIVLIALVCTGYYVVKNIRQKKLEVYGILYFLITISMFTNILVPVVGIVGERFAFIPSLGLCIVTAILLLKIFKIPYLQKEARFSSFSNSLYITTGLIILIFGMMSFARIKAWKDSYTLYATDVKNAPESAHANSLIAAASIQRVKENPKMKMEEKRFHISNAVKYYKESIRIIPEYISSLNNLGMIYYTYYNKPEESIPYLKKAVSLDTNYVEAYFNLATCEAKSNKKKDAEAHYLKTLQINPKFFDAYYSLSSLYAEDKQYDKIIELNQNAINKGLRSPTLNINIGNVYFTKGDTARSIPYFESGIAIDPNNKTLDSFLANYFKNRGDLEKANHYYDLMARSTQ